MIDHIQRIRDEAEARISSAANTDELEKLRVHYLGKKGLITALLHQLRELSQEKRREVGAVLNRIKEEFETSFLTRQQELYRTTIDQEVGKTPPLDLTLPGQFVTGLGSLHPVSLVSKEAIRCLRNVGFSVASGPEVETEYYNFEALNTPENHPARDLHDTFYIRPPVLLRSHTSPVQVRVMKKKKPPLQIIAPGKVYRSDYDATHTPMFQQIEGLMVDTDISFAELKGVLFYFVKEMFGARPLRFRPSYFPFTEPSAEVDMQCIRCRGKEKTCRVCSGTGWLEIAGCGMVHPNVFKAVGYEPDAYTGFAFGIGIERMTMLKYGLDDLRSLYENDQRILEQF